MAAVMDIFLIIDYRFTDSLDALNLLDINFNSEMFFSV